MLLGKTWQGKNENGANNQEEDEEVVAEGAGIKNYGDRERGYALGPADENVDDEDIFNPQGDLEDEELINYLQFLA